MKMAEGGVHLEKSKSLIDCSICYETFKQPKFLPCHHTFCAICLEKYIGKSRKGNTFECPLCRKVIDVPTKGVNEFQTNFYLVTEDSEQQQTIICDGCDDNIVAGHRCLDCEEHFCSRCTKSHMKMKVTRHHKLIQLDLEQTGTKRRIKARLYCENHPNEEIKILCTQCNQLLCVLCMLLNHQGHKLREVTEAASELRQKLQAKVEEKKVNDTLTRQKKIACSFKETVSKLTTSQDREINALRHHGANVHKALDEVIAIMEATLIKEYKSSVEEIENLSKLSDTFSLSLQSLISTTFQVIQQASDVEILQKGNSLYEKLLWELEKDPVGVRSMENQNKGNLFTRGDFDTNVLQTIIGTIEGREAVKSMVQKKREVTPIRDRLVKVGTIATTDGKGVWDIALISKGRAWVCLFSHPVLQQTDSTGRILLSVDLGSHGRYSIAADGDDNCIISVGSSIKRVSSSGKLNVIVPSINNTVDGLAYRRRSNGNEEILLSCGVSTPSAVFVAPYCTNATAVRWLSREFKYVHSIAVDEVTQKVCIGDHDGRSVTVFNEDGEMLSEYKTAFTPFRACFDFHGAIIIAQWNNPSSLQRIKTDGTFVETLSNVIGSSVATYKSNRIWVGKQNGGIEIYEMK